MLEPYRPEFFAEVSASARRQPEFDYLRAIIKAHREDRLPGDCWVWRTRGRISAFCALAYLNRGDAWLYGMRVNDEFKGQGIATRLTRRLFGVARAAGRTWVALDTKDVPSKAPVFRICTKLGMRHKHSCATAMLWNLPGHFRPPRLRPMPGMFAHLQKLGVPTILEQRSPLWRWSRLLPGRRQRVNRHGFVIAGLPVLIEHDKAAVQPGRPSRWTVANLYDRPPDFRGLVSSLSGLAAGGKDGLVVNYPAEWQRELRRAAAVAVPGLKFGRNCFFGAWRIYAKHLS